MEDFKHTMTQCSWVSPQITLYFTITSTLCRREAVSWTSSRLSDPSASRWWPSGCNKVTNKLRVKPTSFTNTRNRRTLRFLTSASSLMSARFPKSRSTIRWWLVRSLGQAPQTRATTNWTWIKRICSRCSNCFWQILGSCIPQVPMPQAAIVSDSSSHHSSRRRSATSSKTEHLSWADEWQKQMQKLDNQMIFHGVFIWPITSHKFFDKETWHFHHFLYLSHVWRSVSVNTINNSW